MWFSGPVWKLIDFSGVPPGPDGRIGRMISLRNPKRDIEDTNWKTDYDQSKEGYPAY